MVWGNRVKAAARFAWENFDAILVMGVATIVVALDVLVSSLDPQIVSAATLALLGATAFILLRDRKSRSDLDDLRQVANDALSDLPYDILWQENEWDIVDRERATITMTQRLRFTRNEVSTLPHWSTGDGSITSCIARWKRPSTSQWIEAREIHSLATRGGKRLLFSLEEEHGRGDMLDWRVEREALDRFSSNHEAVTHEAKTASDFPRRVRLIWPEQDPPTHIEMRLGEAPARPLSGKTEAGRLVVDETIGKLEKGEVFTVSWTW